ncbi:MAG: mycofactocin biosynthesis peptidyl-dipeptidase MftE [Acidimicrobiales bacterium]
MAASPDRLDARTSPEVGDARRTTLLIPLGATEQHGPHLPIGTDSIIATAWAEAVAERVDGVLVAPTLPYGSSGEHQAFPGTLSIGNEALHLVLVELARSARHDVDRVVFVSGHAGNAHTLDAAVNQLRSEGHDAHYVVPRLPGADAHAGHTETSLMLHLAPHLVRTDRAVPGTTTPLSEVIDRLRAEGLAPVAPTGVLGDPSGADADEGRRLFELLVSGLAASLA